jgi:hypothetical protein
MKLEVTHRDPIVSIDDLPSYAKLVRFTADAHQYYELEIDSWCDCPITAILWGGSDPTVFMPRVTVMGPSGALVTGVSMTTHYPEWTWRSTSVRRRWTIDVESAGPYYLLITSDSAVPKVVRVARNWTPTLSAPVGKMGLKLERGRAEWRRP